MSVRVLRACSQNRPRRPGAVASTMMFSSCMVRGSLLRSDHSAVRPLSGRTTQRAERALASASEAPPAPAPVGGARATARCGLVQLLRLGPGPLGAQLPPPGDGLLRIQLRTQRPRHRVRGTVGEHPLGEVAGVLAHALLVAELGQALVTAVVLAARSEEHTSELQ